MTKETIIFYKEWLTLINSLPDKSRLEFYDLIFSQDKVVLSKIKDAHLRSVLDFVQQKIDKNHVKYEEVISKRKLAGIKSGEARRKKGTKRTSVQSVKQKGTKRTDIDNVNVNDSVNVSDKEINNERFEEFWNLYDYKKSKPKAMLAYEKAIKIDSHENILNGVKAYIKARGNDKQYWKHPTTWLNAHAWQDEYSTKNNKHNNFEEQDYDEGTEGFNVV